MKTIGFVISHKENEKRRALLPQDLNQVKNVNNVFVETGYGDVLGYSDEDYARYGATICSRDEALSKDIICDPKVGDAEYLDNLREGQTIFGWVHAVQNRDITDKLLNNKLTAVTWEDMYYKGRHIFWRNNEIAGEAAIMHAFSLHGVFPYDTKVAILGRGNIARGACRILTSLGAEIVQYDRRTEALFQEELGNYDVVINAILWDVNRKDHIIYKEDLKRMKRNALIIDISCDKNGGVETSVPTTINDPVYVVDGVTHYVVDHTPSIFYKTITKSLSAICAGYIDMLIEEESHWCEVLKNALAVRRGIVVDERINKFQGR